MLNGRTLYIFLLCDTPFMCYIKFAHTKAEVLAKVSPEDNRLQGISLSLHGVVYQLCVVCKDIVTYPKSICVILVYSHL